MTDQKKRIDLPPRLRQMRILNSLLELLFYGVFAVLLFRTDEMPDYTGTMFQPVFLWLLIALLAGALVHFLVPMRGRMVRVEGEERIREDAGPAFSAAFWVLTAVHIFFAVYGYRAWLLYESTP